MRKYELVTAYMYLMHISAVIAVVCGNSVSNGEFKTSYVWTGNLFFDVEGQAQVPVTDNLCRLNRSMQHHLI